MSLNDVIVPPKRIMVLFFIIDSSGSMAGSKIGTVNTAIQEALLLVRDISEKNADAQVKIAVLEFSSGIRWITDGGPVDVEEFHWDFLTAAGVTDFGDACRELDQKLSSTTGFFTEQVGYYLPAIILLSDGAPTDDWIKHLTELKKNRYFLGATKVAIAIGHDAEKEVLKEFTGSIESVMEVYNAEVLKKMIKFVVATVTKGGTKGGKVNATGETTVGQTNQKEIEEQIRQFTEENASEIASSPDKNDPEDW